MDKIRLTKRSVEQLQAAGTDYFTWDSELSGFGVRVMPSGRKCHLVRYRADRRSRRQSIGQHGALTADHARVEAGKLLGEVARGGIFAEERHRDPPAYIPPSPVTSVGEVWGGGLSWHDRTFERGRGACVMVKRPNRRNSHIEKQGQVARLLHYMQYQISSLHLFDRISRFMDFPEEKGRSTICLNTRASR